MARDLQFFLGRDNLNLVSCETKKFEAARSCRSNIVAMLSDAAGEDQKVNTTEQSDVRANGLAHGKSKDIQGKDGRRIPRARPLFQPLHVALSGGKSEETALMIEQIFKLVRGELLNPQKI